MNKPNYQKELEKILNNIVAQTEGGKAGDERAEVAKNPPTLFLHSCCAPCSSYVLKYLREYFKITVYYYNPNISEQDEYRKRVEEQKRLIEIYNRQLKENVDGYEARGEMATNGAPVQGYLIDIVEGDYEPEVFFDMARPYKDCPEGGERCFLCYELRLARTLYEAEKRGSDFYGTTLTISPLKNAEKLNEIGFRLADGHEVKWLPSDFKKREGYKQSIQLSAEYGLYRQDYCGCIYSKLERERQKQESKEHIL